MLASAVDNIAEVLYILKECVHNNNARLLRVNMWVQQSYEDPFQLHSFSTAIKMSHSTLYFGKVLYFLSK